LKKRKKIEKKFEKKIQKIPFLINMSVSKETIDRFFTAVHANDIETVKQMITDKSVPVDQVGMKKIKIKINTLKRNCSFLQYHSFVLLII